MNNHKICAMALYIALLSIAIGGQAQSGFNLMKIATDETQETADTKQAKPQFNLMYITSSPLSDSNKLFSLIKGNYNNETDNVTVFYLANRKSPIILTNKNEWTDVEKLNAIIQDNDVLMGNGKYDCEKILDILDENEFLDVNGGLNQRKFSEMTFDFYLTSATWPGFVNDFFLEFYNCLNTSVYASQNSIQGFFIFNFHLSPKNDFPENLTPEFLFEASDGKIIGKENLTEFYLVTF
ncbi:MAG: hypothetical protein LUD17_11280 [Bacteroidales bacterium]|nr:hypothetical protein [Bacteroidales bacterium]